MLASPISRLSESFKLEVKWFCYYQVNSGKWLDVVYNMRRLQRALSRALAATDRRERRDRGSGREKEENREALSLFPECWRYSAV